MTHAPKTSPGKDTNAKTIVIVDDDSRLCDLLQRFLSAHGFNVLIASHGQKLLEIKRQYSVDLIVLDLMLPDLDGMALCRQLRAGDDYTPIIMLTARDQASCRILGLELGADDYLVKPFNPRELVARIRAVLRRSCNKDHPASPSPKDPTFCFGPYELNLAKRKLTKTGCDITLTTGEFAILKVFARYPNEVLSRDRLMELSRGREYTAFDRSLDVQISRLRKIIEDDPTKPTFIQTIWGKGYVFVTDVQT